MSHNTHTQTPRRECVSVWKFSRKNERLEGAKTRRRACSQKCEASFAGAWGVPDQQFRNIQKDIPKHCWRMQLERSDYIGYRNKIVIGAFNAKLHKLVKVHVKSSDNMLIDIAQLAFASAHFV